MRSMRCAVIVLVGLGLTTLGRAASAPVAEDAEFQKLFSSVDAFWSQQVAALGGRYRPPNLMYFGEPLKNLCGVAAALSGPFYCPVNESVYLDRGFLQQLKARAGTAASAAVGFVIAHEVAHHLQNVIGTTTIVEQARSSSTAAVAQRTLTSFELQADCYAGLWLHWARNGAIINGPVDLAATLATVAALSQEQQSHLRAGQQWLDPLTMGEAAQRLKWLQRGSDSGDFNACDTFGAAAAGTL
jgi:predicted metalloprotease